MGLASLKRRGAPGLLRRAGSVSCSSVCCGVARSAFSSASCTGSQRPQAMHLEAAHLEERHLGKGAHLRAVALDALSPRPRCAEPSLWPDSRPASTSDAAMRFRSHSKGPRMVSSKSLMSKTRRPSGAANAPRLRTCASPQSWLTMPVFGSTARSAAITGTAPRK